MTIEPVSPAPKYRSPCDLQKPIAVDEDAHGLLATVFCQTLKAEATRTLANGRIPPPVVLVHCRCSASRRRGRKTPRGAGRTGIPAEGRGLGDDETARSRSAVIAPELNRGRKACTLALFLNSGRSCKKRRCEPFKSELPSSKPAEESDVREVSTFGHSITSLQTSRPGFQVQGRLRRAAGAQTAPGGDREPRVHVDRTIGLMASPVCALVVGISLSLPSAAPNGSWSGNDNRPEAFRRTADSYCRRNGTASSGEA
jgi:hypothetical protein